MCVCAMACACVRCCRDENKRRSAMIALVKGVAYTIGLGLGIPVFMEVVATWGAAPTWIHDGFLSTAFSAATAMSAMLYAFELTYKNVVTYNVWLHRTAAVVVIAIAATGVGSWQRASCSEG